MAPTLSNAFLTAKLTSESVFPDFLCQTAGLTCDHEAVLVGQGSYFEIWSTDEWALQQKALAETDANSERFKVLDLSTSTG